LSERFDVADGRPALRAARELDDRFNLWTHASFGVVSFVEQLLRHVDVNPPDGRLLARA